MVNKVLLIDIDIDHLSSPGVLLQSNLPVGLLYLVSYLNKKLRDIQFRVFHTITCSDPESELVTLLNEFHPDVVGVRCLTINKQYFRKIVNLVKSVLPAVPLIAGGPYASSSTEEILGSLPIDLIVLAEGEETFFEIISRMKISQTVPTDIEGTASMHDGKLIINNKTRFIEDLDTIPYPDYRYIDLNDYSRIYTHSFQKASESLPIVSSRGCCYGCIYCHNFFGKEVRHRSAGNIVGEIESLIETKGIRNFIFLDDIFNVPISYSKETLKLIIKNKLNIRISFPNGLRADHIDSELVNLLEDAGCVELALAIETASPRVQKLIGKHMNLDKAAFAIDRLSKKFIVAGFFMVGFPTETLEEAETTIRFAQAFDYLAQPSLYAVKVFPNTPLYGLLHPDPEQAVKFSNQEKIQFNPRLFDNVQFYGDYFSQEQVPLKTADINKLIWFWNKNVVFNKKRILNAHTIISRYFNNDEILHYYQGVYQNSKFSERDLEDILQA